MCTARQEFSGFFQCVLQGKSSLGFFNVYCKARVLWVFFNVYCKARVLWVFFNVYCKARILWVFSMCLKRLSSELLHVIHSKLRARREM